MPPPPYPAYRPPRATANFPLVAGIVVTVAVVLSVLCGVTGVLVLRRLNTASFTGARSPHVPAAADFVLTLTILRKHCYGSAGCNIAYRITPAYSGSALAPSQALTVVYVVTGGDSGPQTDSFAVRGDQAEYVPEQTISTSSSTAALTATATQVLPG
ncbi:MAG: hypothetical protein QOI35_1899 [Cryptosporangiaceae bacterium]|nr:hypothetical protein [Cryptosporangiaceae bacterium]